MATRATCLQSELRFRTAKKNNVLAEKDGECGKERGLLHITADVRPLHLHSHLRLLPLLRQLPDRGSQRPQGGRRRLGPAGLPRFQAP